MDQSLFNFRFVVYSEIHGGVITVCFRSRDIEKDLNEALGLIHNVLSTLHANGIWVPAFFPICPVRGLRYVPLPTLASARGTRLLGCKPGRVLPLCLIFKRHSLVCGSSQR